MSHGDGSLPKDTTEWIGWLLANTSEHREMRTVLERQQKDSEALSAALKSFEVKVDTLSAQVAQIVANESKRTVLTILLTSSLGLNGALLLYILSKVIQ
jgi:hypothetical protein